MDDYPDDAFGSLLLDDDLGAEDVPVMTSRELRIAAAVERSKSTYRAEQAFTEAGHFTSMKSPLDGSSPYGRHVEFLATQLYFSKEYLPCLDLCRTIIQTRGVDREVVDLALRAAVHAGKPADVADLVEESKQWWKGTPGLANTAATVYRMQNKLPEALNACLRCIDERGISSAPIAELESIINAWLVEEDGSPELSAALDNLKAGVTYALSDPTRRSDGRVAAAGAHTQVVTALGSTAEIEQAMATALWGPGSADSELIRNFFRKLDGLSRGAGDEAVDRSVRTL